MAGSSIIARLGLDSKDFQKGLAQADRASAEFSRKQKSRSSESGKSGLEGVEKQAKAFEKSLRFVGKLAAGLGLAEAYGRALDYAQKLRDESLQNGKALDANVAALARYGDTIDRIKKSVVEVGVSILGWFPKKGEETGDALVQIFGSNERKRNAGISNDAGSNADRLARGRESAKAVGDFKDKDAVDAAEGPVAKENVLLAQSIKLQRELGRYEVGSLEYNKAKLAVLENGARIREQEAAAVKAEKDAQDKLREGAKNVLNANNDLLDAKSDRSKMTLEELAALGQNGEGGTKGKQSFQARQVQTLESQADQARALGNTEQSDKLRGQADKIRGGLSLLKSDERAPFKGMEDRLKEANDKLKDVVTALGGIFISQ